MKQSKVKPILRHVDRNMQGFTLVHLIIAIIIAIILGISAYCAIGAMATTSLTGTIGGPASIAPDSRGTFPITATYSRALASSVTLRVRVYESDITGNELLSSTGRITIPAGGTSGTINVVLGMSATCHISGTSGTGDEEDEHEIYVELELIGTPPPNTDTSYTSSNRGVKCE